MIKLTDEKEVIRTFFNIQYVKLKKLSAVGSLTLLAINLSLTIFLYMEERDIHPYIGIPLVFIGVMIVLWLAAHIYVRKMEMYRTEQRAEIIFNPYAVYALAPFQEMIYSHSAVPMMKALIKLLPEGCDEQIELKKKLKKFESWCKMGYIPKKDFPDELKQYYLTDKQQRL